MKLENLAALLAIVEFVGKVCKHIWKKYHKPIRKYLSSRIDSIIAFLAKIRRWLNDVDDNNESSIYGVTGGTICSFIYIQ